MGPEAIAYAVTIAKKAAPDTKMVSIFTILSVWE